MNEEKITEMRNRILSNKKLVKLIKKYVFKISTKERGQFLSLIEESYNIGFKEGNSKK